MKTSLPKFLLGAIALFGLALFIVPALQAQTTADPATATYTDTAANIATPIVVGLAAKYPIILTIVAAIGTLRFFCKPVVSLIEAYVKSTASTADDAYLVKVEASAPVKWFSWLLDFVCSVKVGPQFTATPQNPPATTVSTPPL